MRVTGSWIGNVVIRSLENWLLDKYSNYATHKTGWEVWGYNT